MKKALVIAGLLTLIVTSCDDTQKATDTSSADAPDLDNTETLPETTSAPLLNFKETASVFHGLATNATKSMLAQCAGLQSDIQSFISKPTNEGQSKAQVSFVSCYHAWVSSSLYFQTAFNFSEQKQFQQLVDLIDTRPFLPGYIDGIPTYPYSGLVYDLDLPINAGTLRSQHRLMDEDSASVGFPVIEFFLWKTPVETHWYVNDTAENTKAVERRKEYLQIASQLLLDHLTQAVLRWQSEGDFAELPEGAQQAVVLKSLQRMTMVELLAGKFEEAAINEPEWSHPAIISGNGRSYLLAQLDAIRGLVLVGENEAFSNWLSKATDLPVTFDDLSAAINNAYASISQLPENYPLDSTNDDNWKNTRQNVAQLALMFSQLSDYFQVSIITE
jgi:hypothetical protein